MRCYSCKHFWFICYFQEEKYYAKWKRGVNQPALLMPVPSSSSNSPIVLFYKAVSQSLSGETTRIKFSWFMPGREPNYGLVKL